TAMIGVAIMVESFRESLREWLIHTLRADVYVSAPGPAEASQRRLDPAVIRALLATPGIRDHSESRRVEVASPRGALDLNAVRLAHASYAALRFTQGDAAHAWPQFARGAILVSEPLAWRLGLAPHDTLTLTTAAGPRAFAVAGVYREYGNDRGEVLMSLGTYQRLWADEAISGLGIYLAPGVEARRAVGELRAAAGGRQALLIRSNADIRALSMGIFERTFVITRVLYWLAAGVAAVALVSALLAWELERSRELAILRSLGLTPRGTALLVLAQTTFMGVAALAAAIPAGLLTALAPWTFAFPRDHGPHPQFRQEWWYVSGNLDAASGERVGFELTFFRFALQPGAALAPEPAAASAWRTREIYMAHFAIADVQRRRFRFARKLSRAALGLAGAQAAPLHVWIDDWSLEGAAEAVFAAPWRLRAAQPGYELELTLQAQAPPVLNGEAGLRRKSGEPGDATYYYSIPRLSVRGRL